MERDFQSWPCCKRAKRTTYPHVVSNMGERAGQGLAYREFNVPNGDGAGFFGFFRVCKVYSRTCQPSRFLALRLVRSIPDQPLQSTRDSPLSSLLLPALRPELPLPNSHQLSVKRWSSHRRFGKSGIPSDEPGQLLEDLLGAELDEQN